MIKRLLAGVALLIMMAAGGYYFFTPDTLDIGAELPNAPALFETSLAAPITATADSLTLTSNTVRGGGSLSGYNCFTIDEGSAQAEFVCGTASGTAVTNVTRGISPSDGTSADTDLQFSHRRGASVKITDFPIIQLLRNQNNGEATFENALRYAGSVTPSSADELADVGYVLSVVNGGTVTFDALTVAGTAGETLATSTLVYFKSSDQRWWKVDTDDTATFQNVALGLTRGSGTAGTSVLNGGVLLSGLQTGLTGLTAGATYHASSSAGSFNTATSVLPIGVAKSTTELYFDPVMLGVPRLAFNNTFTGTNTFTGSVFGVGSASTTVYTESATYTKSSNLRYVIVEVQAAGGNGASALTTSQKSSGGGGGAYCRRTIPATSLSATTSVVVGAVGATSSFGTFCTSQAGTSGLSDGTNGVAGGTATGGDINIPGQTSGAGDGTAATGLAGYGGDSFLGFGGSARNPGQAGENGVGYGGGGGGGSANDATDRAGGTGAPAVVIITEVF